MPPSVAMCGEPVILPSTLWKVASRDGQRPTKELAEDDREKRR